MQTITITPAPAVPWRGTPALPAWADKAPAAVRTMALDLSRVIGAATVTGATVAASPAGTSLVATCVSTTDSRVVMTLAGGSRDTAYTLSIEATLSDGDVWVGDTRLSVSAAGADSPLPVSPYVRWSAVPASADGLPPGTYYTQGDVLCCVPGGPMPTSADGLPPGTYYLSGDVVCVTPGGAPPLLPVGLAAEVG